MYNIDTPAVDFKTRYAITSAKLAVDGDEAFHFCVDLAYVRFRFCWVAHAFARSGASK